MICLKCGTSWASGIPTSLDSSYKSRIMDGSLFMCKCPSCGQTTLADGPFVYHDEESRVLVVMSVNTLNAQECPEDYTCRQVSDIGSFIEKVKIFDAGLDDLAVEICKYVTAREMGKDVPLKFLGINGSDAEITLAYPDKGQMQMVVVGQNVYSDAIGIIQRNPSIVPDGLAKVDSNYVKLFVG